METAKQNDIIIGQGSFENVLKRIGSNKSNLLCLGTDPLTQSGVIVSKGKIVSSKILDITIHPAENSPVATPKDQYLNKVTIKYIDSIDKRIRKQEFDILNPDALTMLVNNLLKINQYLENQQNLIEKVKKIDEISTKNDEKLKEFRDNIYYIGETINTLKNNVVDDVKFNRIHYKDFNEIQINKKVLGEEKQETIEVLDKDKYFAFKLSSLNKFAELEERIKKLEENIIF